MACFLVPGTEAFVVSMARKAASKHTGTAKPGIGALFVAKLGWLTNMLWGGAALLAFEHVWHGEVTAWFPFLTAAGSAAETTVMFHELATSGVAMTAVVTLVWVGMVLGANALAKKHAAQDVLS